jgi:hypothetical protein
MYSAVPPPTKEKYDEETTKNFQYSVCSTPKIKISLKPSNLNLKQKLALTKLQELKEKRDKISKSLKREEKKEQINFWKKRNLLIENCE